MPVNLDTDTEKAQYRKYFRADKVSQCTLSNKPNYFERCEVEDYNKQPFSDKKFSLGADELAVYYKSGFMQDQPADMFQHIVEEFQSDILLQTWGRPRPYADATFQVNGQSYELKTKGRLECKGCPTSKGPKTWCGGSDHSKWLITDSAQKHISCFGDLNRNTQAQLKRGGAFYCLSHKGLHEALKGIITDTPCETQEEAEPQEEN